MAEGVSSPAADEVKPYKIHIPTKHLELTRQKLELTRLPHEPSTTNPWAPKPVIEPLIDYWLETYSWRTVESRLNTTPSLPQFRTALTPPGSQAPIRIHFIHARAAPSFSSSALPLLLVPPFPLPSLALAPLVQPLTNPEPGPDGKPQQAFHVVIPSLPGTAFSDALPHHPYLSPSSSTTTTGPTSNHGTGGDEGNGIIPATAALLDALMRRLGYAHYLASAVAPGGGITFPSSSATSSAVAGIDERIVRRLARAHATSCVGAHLIAPALEAPVRWGLATSSGGSGSGGGAGAGKAIANWGRWVGARVLGWKGGVYAYERADWEALARVEQHKGKGKKGGMEEGEDEEAALGLGRVVDANTLAYALCDSPVGMLAFVLRALRASAGVVATGGGGGEKGRFTREELVTLASLVWLPGPEGMLRYWAAAGRQREEERRKKGPKPHVAITVFTGGSAKGKGKDNAPAAATASAEETKSTASDEQVPGLWPTAEEVAARRQGYCPPAWASPLFDVVHTQRVPGAGSGLLAFEQPDVILDGVRGLAKAVLAKEPRLRPVAPLEAVVVEPVDAGEKAAQTAAQLSTSPSPAAPVVSAAPATPAAGGGSLAGADAGASAGLAPVTQETDKKEKGKFLELPSPKNPSSEDESPDTLVERSSPLLDTA